MKSLRKMLVLLLCLSLFAVLAPAAWAERNEIPVSEEVGGLTTTEIKENDENSNEVENSRKGYIHVIFDCNPQETEIIVYDLNIGEVWDDNVVFKPSIITAEADGSFVLYPGRYMYDAVCDGYYNICGENFDLSAGDINEDYVIHVNLTFDLGLERSETFLAGEGVTKIDAPPYPNVNTSYTTSTPCGTVRFISQISSSQYFYSSYWGSWASQAGIECGTASISMALSYVGVNKTPNDILTPYSGTTYFCPPSGSWGGTQYLTPSFTTAMNDYLNGNGKYSPPIIHFPNGTLTSAGHYAVVIGKISSNQFYIADPAYNIGTITINGNNWNYKGASGSIDQVRQYYNANAEPASYLDKCTVYPTNLTVKTMSQINLKSLPCSWDTDHNSENLAEIPSGTSFSATELYRNDYDGYDSCWYKVSYQGKEGYIWSGHTTVTAFRPNIVSASGGDPYPETIPYKGGYYVNQRINSQYLRIDTLQGFIYDSNGNALFEGKKSGIKAMSYQLGSKDRDEPVDGGLLFSQLPAGNYSCKVEARCFYYYGDNDGKLQTEAAEWATPISFNFIKEGEPSAPAQNNKIVFHTQGGSLGEPIASRVVDGFNTTRSTGQLIVYNDPSQEIERNSYGHEIGVDSTGRIVSIREYGDESRLSIPNGGFVLSGQYVWPTDLDDGYHFVADALIGQYAGVDYENQQAFIFDSYSDYLGKFKYVKSGAQYGDLPEPIRNDYIFDGWYTAEEGGEKINSASTYITSELFAHWVAETYTITYNANYGAGVPSNQTKTHDIALTLSSTKPTRSNSSAGSYTVTLNANGGSVSPTSLSAVRTTSYSFKNWNTAADGSGTNYASGASYTANADVTLYAQWNSNTTTSAVTLPTPTHSGHTFKGWATSSTASSGVTGNYTPSGNVTLYAIWEAGNYVVTYIANGGTGAPENQTKIHDVALTLSSTTPTRANSSAGSYTITLNANGGSVSPASLSAARTTSYSFKNWNTAADGSGTSYASDASYTANADVTLYAQWNGDTTTSAVTLPTPTRSGYTFRGWATSSAASSGVTGSYTPSGNVTLYAVWEIVVPEIASGTWGDLSWTLDANGVLTISGNGPMDGFNSDSTSAWRAYKDEITSVRIESGVTSVGSYAFTNCTELTSVTLPEGLTSFDKIPFAECVRLTSITIPVSVTNIYDMTFSGCNAVTDVYYGGTQTQWNAVTIGEDNGSLLNATIHFGGEVSGVAINETNFPDPIFRAYVIENCDTDKNGCLSDAEIASVTVIGVTGTDPLPEDENGGSNNSTANDNRITTLIGVKFFTSLQELYCEMNQLTELDVSGLPALQTLYCSYNRLTELNVSGCTALQMIYCINNQLTELDVNDCTMLDSLLCYNNQLAKLDLSSCPELTVLLGSDNQLTELNVKNCSKLGLLECQNNQLSQLDISDCQKLIDTVNETVPTTEDGITSYIYGNYMFRYDEGVKLITVSTNASGTWGDLSWTLDANGVLTISGSGAMADLDSNAADAWLARKDSIISVVIEPGVTSIGGRAFYRCSALESAEIPAGVTSIGSEAFGRCTALTNVTIPEGVTSIGHDAFFYCKALTDVVIPDSVKKIDYCAFQDCNSLTELVLPSGLMAISKQLFLHCSGLEIVTIPAGVASIGRSAFSGCDSLTDVYYSGTQQQWSSITIGSNNDTLKNAIIHCSDGIVFNFVLPVSLTTIEAEAFSGGAFSSVKLPETTTAIGSRAFADCQNLAYIYIPEATGSIARDAFEGVSGLTILGQCDSYAEFYAQRNGIAFVAVG